MKQQQQLSKQPQQSLSKKQMTQISFDDSFKYKNDNFYFYRFYDDMPCFLQQINSLNDEKNKFIECILVNRKPHKLFQINQSNDPSLYNKIMYKESKNHYTALLKSKLPETDMPTNGITHKQLDDLILWSSYYPEHKKYVFFDWDQTLSCVSGITYNSSFNFKDDDVLSYLLGGNKRRIRLSEVFQTLHNNNCEIYILSNNNTLVTHEDFFLRMINLLSPGKFKKKHLLPSRKTNGNKKDAFEKFFFKNHKDSV